MQDRIRIDGVWYVRESITTIPEYKVLKRHDVTEFVGVVYETDSYCFEASMLFKDDGTLYPDVSIKVTDKRGDRDDWTDEYIDGTEWMRNLYHQKTEHVREASSMWCRDGISQFCSFLAYLETKGWIDLT